VVDLGVTLSTFNVDIDQSFDLSTSPFYNDFLKDSRNNISFVVVAADSTGPLAKAGAKQLFVTANAGGLIAAPNNFDLWQFTGTLNSFKHALNQTPNKDDFLSTHRTTPNGSSVDRASGGRTSFDVVNLGILSKLEVKLVGAGKPAELFAIRTVEGDSLTPAQVVDFYSEVESAEKSAASFVFDITTGRLNYVGAPKELRGQSGPKINQ
jgi:hypothetical protein